MDCKYIQNNLVQYIENELSVDKIDGIKEHLDSCKECSDLFSEISLTYDILGDKEEIEPKAFFAESVLSKMLREEELQLTESSVFENLFSKYFKEIAYSALTFIVLLTIVFYLSEGTFIFSSLSDSDFLTSDNISSLFFE